MLNVFRNRGIATQSLLSGELSLDTYSVCGLKDFALLELYFPWWNLEGELMGALGLADRQQ